MSFTAIANASAEMSFCGFVEENAGFAKWLHG